MYGAEMFLMISWDILSVLTHTYKCVYNDISDSSDG